MQSFVTMYLHPNAHFSPLLTDWKLKLIVCINWLDLQPAIYFSTRQSHQYSIQSLYRRVPPHAHPPSLQISTQSSNKWSTFQSCWSVSDSQQRESFCFVLFLSLAFMFRADLQSEGGMAGSCGREGDGRDRQGTERHRDRQWQKQKHLEVTCTTVWRWVGGVAKQSCSVEDSVPALMKTKRIAVKLSDTQRDTFLLTHSHKKWRIYITKTE